MVWALYALWATLAAVISASHQQAQIFLSEPLYRDSKILPNKI
jgi:hypothetical protein